MTVAAMTSWNDSWGSGAGGLRYPTTTAAAG